MNSQDKNLLVERYARGKENSLIEKYIVDGPAKVRKGLNLSKEEWKVVFDYLVFEHNLLYKCVTANSDFFVDEYVQFGMTYIREVFDVVEDKYDMVLDVVFDFIAISNEALYYHVIEHRDRYTIALKARGADFVRKVLGIWKDKYEENWKRVLDFLLNAVCDAIFSERTFDHSLTAFSRIMNNTREHRPIFKSGIIV